MGISKRVKNNALRDCNKNKLRGFKDENSSELLKGKYMLLFTLEWSRRMCERP